MDRAGPHNRIRASVSSPGALLREIAHLFHWRDTGPLTAGTIGAQLITVVTLPLLSRLYSPEAFGLFAVAQSFAAVFALLSTLNLAGIIPTIPQTTLATRFTATLLCMTAITAVLLAIGTGIVLLMWPSLLSAHLRPIALGAVLTGLSGTSVIVMRNFHIKLCTTRTVARAQIARSIVTVASAVLFAAGLPIFTQPAVGLIVSTALGDFTAIIWFFVVLQPRQKRQLILYRPRRLVQEVLRRRKLVAGAAWSHTLNNLLGQAPLWVVTAAFGTTQAGWFSLANRVVSIPTSFVGSTVTGILGSRISVDYHRGKPIGRTIRSIMLTLAVVSFMGYGVLALASWVGTTTVFGQQWAGAATCLMILSLMGFMVFMTSALTFVPLMLGAARFLTVWSSARAIADAIVLGVAWRQGWSFDTMVLLYAVTEAVSYFVYLRFVLTATAKPKSHG